MVSGAEVDKVAVCKFTIFYGVLKNAPLIEQCPVNLACKVEHILELGTHHLIMGRVEETHVSENCLTDGKPDLRKLILFSTVWAPHLNILLLGIHWVRDFPSGKN